ncbi:MAG TPA: hypothetical protein VIF12_01660 [Micavibrio sp.]|jgi:uncharacterized membrane protein
MSHIVTATFRDRAAAESALARLEGIGITDSQVSMVVTDEARGNHFKIEDNTKADKGAAAGATVGGIVGAALGALMSASVIVIPGLNLVVTGALAAGLAGLGAGAATGGLVGALVGAGIPEHEAKIYEKELIRGSVLVAIDTRDNEQKKRVKEMFESTQAYNIAA